MNNDEKRMIRKLKQLPKVTDHMSKEELYEKVRMNMNRSVKANTTQKSKYSKKIIPIFSTALVIVIVLLMLPSLVNDTMFNTSESQTFDSNKSFDVEMDTEESSSTTPDQTKKSLEKEDFAENNTSINNSKESYVSYIINSINKHSTLIHAAVVEEQLQYVIPISLISEESSDLSFFYNNLDHYLKEDEWGVIDYMLKDAVFEMDISNNQVIMELPDHFSLGDGTARANVFGEMLTMMFQPYGINRVVFNNHNEIDLGPYGKISETELLETITSNYKLFKHPEADQAFLTPVKQPDQTIVEALNDMKNDEDLSNVSQTIPNDVNFKVNLAEDELLIHFSDDTTLKNEQLYITMIEAILMTAKSYQYEEVTFENYNIERIGPYDLTESLDVPLAVNPIKINH